MSNPYLVEEIPHDSESSPQARSRPMVVLWFKIYAAVLAVIYFLCTVAGLALMFTSIEDPDTPPWFFNVMGGVVFSMGLVLMIACIVPFLMKPRPWLWVYDLVLICLGMTSACFLLFCIPLLIFWFKPETKRYFGREA